MPTGGFFSGESRLFPIQSLSAGGGRGQVSDEYNGLRPGDIPAWSARYEYFVGREVLAPDGNYYRAVSSHTASQSFAADLGAGLWILFAGSGIGDLITGFTYNPLTGALVLTADTSGVHTVNITNIYLADGTIGTNRVATLTDTLTFTGGFGNVLSMDGATGIITIPGFITDPTGVQFSPVNANPVVGPTLWSNATDGNRPYWDNANKIAFISDIPAAATTIYTGDGVTGAGRTVTVTDTLTFTGPAGMFVLQDGTEGIPGYIWTSIDANGTGAWIPSPTASTNIYNSDGIISDATRTAQIDTTLIFNHGLAGVNGYFQLTSGGLLRNQTSIATNFMEYNNVNGILLLETDTHSVTGIRANNTGGVNPTALVELFAGSNNTAYLNIGPTTTLMNFYANNTAVNAGSYNSIGDWGFGTSPSAGAKVTIHSASGQGFGTIISTGNLSPAESALQVRNAAAANMLNVSATGRTTISTECWIGTNTGSIPVGSPLAVKGYDSSVLTRNFGFWDIADAPLFQMQNDGSMGINQAPGSGDRLKITAGARDGAINISASNLNANGYAILAQGGSAGANYNGIWSDVTMGGTGIAKAFNGSSGVSGYSQNFGGYFLARNGSTWSVGVRGEANGGDSVTPTDFAAGIWGAVGATEADDRRAGYFSIGQFGNINNTLTYGAKIEVTYVSGVANEDAWGVYSDCSVDGASATNVAGYFNAAGGGATNYALITEDGRVVMGAAAATVNNSLVEVHGDLEIIGDVDGLVVEDRTAGTRHRAYLDGGVWLFEAA